jgi:hypothetical protein
MKDQSKGRIRSPKAAVVRPMLLVLLVLGITAAILIPLYVARNSAMMESSPPESASQLAKASPGSQATIVCEVTSLPSHTLIEGFLLQQNSDGSYSRASQQVQIQWNPSGSYIVMGSSKDIHQGAVLQVRGRIETQRVIHADQFVVLTGAVTVH